MIISRSNPLLATDVYKMGHLEQYEPSCTKIYSYFSARNGSLFKETLFFGLQYYLKEYLSIPITKEMGEEFLKYRKLILGSNSALVEKKIRQLCDLKYFPVEIKSVEEGDIIPVKNVLLTITNTKPDFYWVVGFLESLIIKIWYPITVATCCYEYKKLVEKFFKNTVNDNQYDLREFIVHDFGYRGDKSEESASISGAAHLINFLGCETVTALPFIERYYNALPDKINMVSVPASEHSVMSSFGRDNELRAFEHMLDVYPKGMVSIVSDTYDIYRVLTEFVQKLKSRILTRDGKVVFRPDSGNPEYIICGDPNYPSGSNENKGALLLLEEAFGSSLNDKGYKVLNEKVGLIYGDAMHLERYKNILERMEIMGFAASNLVIGVGRYLRDFNRDTMGFAIKATYAEIGNQKRFIEKDPVTDKSKKSHKGLLCLNINDKGEYSTIDMCTLDQEKSGVLQTVWKDGCIVKESNIYEIRKKINKKISQIYS